MSLRMSRRQAAKTLLLASTGLALSACVSGSPGAVALETAQNYATTVADALAAAAQAYTAQAGAVSVDVVQKVADDLEKAAHEFAALGDVSTARSAALSVLGFAQQLAPLVAAFLGAAAPYVPIALVVIQAFIQALPMPAEAPVQPPAALRAQAAKLRRH